MSDRASTFFPSACSGDMYAAVPTTRPSDVRGRSPAATVTSSWLTSAVSVRLRQAEVHHLDPAVRAHHHVARLEVAVHDPGGVGGRQSIRDRDGVLQGLAETHAVARDQVGEGLARHVLHDDEDGAVGLADVVDRDDVGVVEGGRGLRLLDEAPPALGVRHLVRRQHLEGHEAVRWASRAL